jgi:imidazolonepropionase-like amidohydrolase
MKQHIPLFALIAGSLWVASTLHAAPQIPGGPQQRPVALVGGTVHTAAGPEMPGATVLFAEGKIVAIGRELALPDDVERIDVTGKHVYPGLFDACTQVGLIEIEAVRATRDNSETGQINPNARSQVAFNPDSELIPVGRSNGVLLVLSAPLGGLVSGTSAVMQMDGWTWEDMTVKGSAGVHLHWPRTRPLSDGFFSTTTADEPSRRQKAIESIRQAFADARAYLAAKKAASPGRPEPKFDARWEAMIPVLEGKLPVIAHADQLQQIQGAVALAAKEQVKLIILGGYDAPRSTELLKQQGVPVIIQGVHRLPQRTSDPYDAAYTVARRLHEAGVPFCISGGDDPWNVRNLPYHAAAAAAHGLPRDEALRAITLYPAQILGVQDRIGSLESGKDATLFVSNGDVLEIPSRVELAFIQGRRVDLSDRQKRLWEKYREKYRRLGIGGE